MKILLAGIIALGILLLLASWFVWLYSEIPISFTPGALFIYGFNILILGFIVWFIKDYH